MQQFEELQTTLAQIYASNINYLKINHNHIYNLVLEFENKNIENWYINFIDNKFELSNTEGFNTYNCDPFFDASFRVENIDKSMCFSLIAFNPFLSKNQKYSEIKNATDFLDEYIHKINFETLNTIEASEKFIFAGTLLGIHLNDIHRKLQKKTYLIIEPNIEIFRLSLFLCDYSEFLNSKIFFAIGDMNIDEVIKTFVDYECALNNFIHLELASASYAYMIEQINISLLGSNELTYPFAEYVVGLERGLRYFNDKKTNFLMLGKNHNFLANKPVLYLGAGPSLPKNIEWVYMNQDKFVVACASAALKRLELLDIVPDIILVVDAQEMQVMRQFEVNDKYYKNSIVLASSQINGKVFDKIFSKNLFFVSGNIEIFDDVGYLNGVTVGDIGIDILCRLGVQKLYLLGFDAAIRNDGKTHDGLHSSGGAKINTAAMYKIADSINMNNHIVWVKGNFRDKVPTLMLYKSMIESVNEILKKHSAEVYNLSDGAFFENSSPFVPDAVKLDLMFCKSDLHEFLIANLLNISKSKLTKSEVEHFQNEVKIMKKIEALSSDIENIVDLVVKNHDISISMGILYKFIKLCLPYATLCADKKIFENQLKQLLRILGQIFAVRV